MYQKLADLGIAIGASSLLIISVGSLAVAFFWGLWYVSQALMFTITR